jgi:RNA polymerase sigma-70 factor (ECF subfamily)
MTTLWRKAHMFDPAKASVSTWIFTVARNRKIDILRKERRPEPDDLPWGPEAEPEQEEVMVIQQETRKLGEALADLPDKQKDLILKAYYGELSHSEIAEQTGLPLGTIKSRIRLALDRLRRQMT